MDSIMALADRHRLWVVEDAAQAVMAYYKGRALGSIGHLGCYSFHETKNYTAGGEGGALCINVRIGLNVRRSCGKKDEPSAIFSWLCG